MKEKKKRRKQTKPLRTRLIKQLDTIFSQYIRERDRRCVHGDASCRGPIQAGHLIRRGNHATRWDELNCHGECSGHNYKHNFYPELYTTWFVEKYGQAAYTALVARSRTIRKHTAAELEALIQEYQDKLLRLL